MRAIATDLDGTVLRADGSLSPFSREVLEAATATGIELVLATARRPCTAFAAVPVGNWGVCLNGALVRDRSGRMTLEERTVPIAVAIELERWLATALPTARLSICDGDRLILRRDEAESISARRRIELVIVDSIADTPCSAFHALNIWLDGVRADDAIDMLHATLPSDVAVARVSSPHSINVSACKVSKSSGMAILAEYLSIDAQQVIAYGDMPNDCDLLAWAGHGVAVADGHPDVRRIADHVTGSSESDGPAHHLRTLL
ncbi:MAG: HAD hydrolase family protein [Actinomycetota bacterium]